MGNVTLLNSLYKNECNLTKNFLSTNCKSLRCWALEEDIEKHEVPSRYPDVPISNQPYFDFIWGNREKHFNKTAMVDGITGKTLSYLETYNKAKNFGGAIKLFSENEKDVLAMILPNCVEFPIIFSGAASVNVPTTTMSPIYTPFEIARQLKFSGATMAVTNTSLLPAVSEAVANVYQETKKHIKIILTDGSKSGCLNFTDMTSEARSDMEIDIDVDQDVATLPFSSGTTGLPKGVMLTHKNLVANVCQQIFGPSGIRIVDESTEMNQQTMLCLLPLFHIYSMNKTMSPALRTGAKLLMLPKFNPSSFIKALEDHKPTILHVTPPLVSFLATHPGVTLKHMESVQHILTAAAPAGAALMQQFKSRFPSITIREGWGMSELSPLALLNPLNEPRDGSCGLPVPNTTFKVIDVVTGKNLEANKEGEICCKGPQVMKGYLNNKKATYETINYGWLHTGDIGYYDEDGYFFIVDRLKELIRVKGYQVAPAELEDMLRTMDGVKDVAVIGIPHDETGEAPRAYIVRNEKSLITSKDVYDFVATRSAPYKQLVGGIEFMEQIPRSHSGKILRKDLRAMYDRYKA